MNLLKSRKKDGYPYKDGPHCLIDCDSLVYSSGGVVQHKVYRVYPKNKTPSDDFFNSHLKEDDANTWVQEHGPEDFEVHKELEVEPLSHAVQILSSKIKSILEATKAGSFSVYLTGSNNFRDEIVDYYKAHRDPNSKPFWYKELREYLVNKWGAIVVDGQEADDAVSIELYRSFVDTESVETVCAHIDKDIDTVPGWHYNWDHDKKYFLTEVEANRNFYKQMLQGDYADNIPGLYKITGKRCSKKFLQKLDTLETELDMWEYVKDVYWNAKLYTTSPEWITVYGRLLEIGKLLRMRRYEGEIWEPPGDTKV